MKHRLARSMLAILFAATGLVMIIWDVTENVFAHHFLMAFAFPIFIPIGLAAIALAEYLWATEVRGERLPARQHEVIRIALVVLEAIVGAAAIDGGLALVRGAFLESVPVAWLAGTPFSDYTIPGLVLAIGVGGGALLAAATVFIHREWAVAVSALVGLLMAGYEVVEIVSIDGKVGAALPIALAAQLLFFALGMAIFGLAWALWTREYPRRRFHTRGVSHA